MKPQTAKRPSHMEASARWASRQDEILETAARLFAKHGYSETDTQFLADELNVGKGTLYRYFPSKEKLFLAAADRVMVKLCQGIDADIAGIADPFEQITVAIRAFLRFFAKHPEYVELLMQERAQFKDRKKPTYFEHREANVERWRDMYRALIAEGRVRDIPVERITDSISDRLYGAIFSNYFAPRSKPIDDQVADIIDVFFHGILTDAERKRRERPAQTQNGTRRHA